MSTNVMLTNATQSSDVENDYVSFDPQYIAEHNNTSLKSAHKNNMLLKALQNSGSDYKRGNLEKIKDVMSQCKAIIGPPTDKTLCWLCGFPVSKYSELKMTFAHLEKYITLEFFDETSDNVNDRITCEHVIPIKLAKTTLGLYEGLKVNPTGTTDCHSILEYSHNFCNWIKNKFYFFKIPKQKINRGIMQKIEIISDDLLNTSLVKMVKTQRGVDSDFDSRIKISFKDENSKPITYVCSNNIQCYILYKALRDNMGTSDVLTKSMFKTTIENIQGDIELWGIMMTESIKERMDILIQKIKYIDTIVDGIYYHYYYTQLNPSKDIKDYTTPDKPVIYTSDQIIHEYKTKLDAFYKANPFAPIFTECRIYRKKTVAIPRPPASSTDTTWYRQNGSQFFSYGKAPDPNGSAVSSYGKASKQKPTLKKNPYSKGGRSRIYKKHSNQTKKRKQKTK